MNTLAGVFARKGGVADERLSKRLYRALQRFGPDGQEMTGQPRISLMRLSFRVGPSETGAEPVYADCLGNMICLSGRIDNRNEILKGLSPDGEIGTDAGILLALYVRGGVQALGQLIGEFVAVIWDVRAQTLCLVGDPLGRHNLYYHLTAQQLVWSTRPRILADCVSSADNLDFDYLANFVLNRESESCPYRGISRLAAGCALTVSPERVETTRYWMPAANQCLRYKTDADYEEHFRGVFFEAVRCRIDNAGPYFCELSGGLDSSSIAAAASKLDEREGRQHLNTVSYTFPGSLDADESAYITDIAGAIGAPHLELTDRECPLFLALPDDLRPDFPTGDLVFFSRHQRLLQIMGRRGARMILSGIGGDQLFWSSPHVLLPLLDAIARRDKKWQLLSRARQCAEVAGSHFCVPLFMALWWSVRYRGSPYPLDSEKKIAGWFDSRFVSHAGTEKAEREAIYNPVCKIPSRAHQYLLIRRTMRDFALDRTLGAPLEIRYPYLDQRVIQFALALPFDQCVRYPETRSIVRRSLRNLLPHKICYRTTKADSTEPCIRALIRNWPGASSAREKLLIAELGIVNAERFAAALARMRCGLVDEPRQLVSALTLELWLRTIYRDQARAHDPVHATSLRSSPSVNTRKENTDEYTTVALQ